MILHSIIIIITNYIYKIFYHFSNLTSKENHRWLLKIVRSSYSKEKPSCNLRENTSVRMDWEPLIWKRGWNSVGERRGAYKGRENFSVRHRSVGMAARLVRGNTRNKFRNLTAIPPGARTFEFSCGARDGKLLPLLLALFQHLSRRPLLSALAGISKNSLFNGERERSLFSNIIKVFQSSPLPSRSWEEWGRVIRPRILMKAVFFFQSKIRKVNICIRSFIYSLYRWIRGKICLMFKIE